MAKATIPETQFGWSATGRKVPVQQVTPDIVRPAVTVTIKERGQRDRRFAKVRVVPAAKARMILLNEQFGPRRSFTNT